MFRFSSVEKALQPLGWVVAGVTVLALLTAPPAQTQAAATNVLVTNTTTQPVPVAVQGTPTVKVDAAGNLVRVATNGNTVKLDASVNTVKVDGTANVVKATQSGFWALRVNNPKTAPVPTYNARDGMEPFQASLSGNPLTVPAGKRMVIEYVGLRGNTLDGYLLNGPELITTVGGVTTRHELGFENVGTAAGYTLFQGGNATRIYADPNSQVVLDYSLWPGGGAGNVALSLSGYLIPYP